MHCKIVDPQYHGTAKSSHSSGELTATGEAMIIWIDLQPPSTTSNYEIYFGSAYAFNAMNLADPPIPSSSSLDLIRWFMEGL